MLIQSLKMHSTLYIRQVQAEKANFKRSDIVDLLGSVLPLVIDQEYDPYVLIDKDQLVGRMTTLFQMTPTDANNVEILSLIALMIREGELRGKRLDVPEKAVLSYYASPNPAIPMSSDEKNMVETLRDFMPRKVLDNVYGKYFEIANSATTQAQLIEQKAINLRSSIETGLKRIEEWEQDLPEKEERVKQYQQQLKNVENAYNFVGLADAFKNMMNQKRRSRFILSIALFFSGIILLAPLAIQFIDSDSLKSLKIPYSSTEWPRLLPIFGVEIILLYFFRILLLNFYKLSDAIVELHLRWSLCAFIQSYVDFAGGKTGEVANGRLARFEAVIFSGLNREMPDIPKTIDFLDSVATVAKSFKER